MPRPRRSTQSCLAAAPAIYSVPLQCSLVAPSPSASPHRDRDLAFGIPWSGFPSWSIRLSVGVAVMASRRPPHVHRPPSGREIIDPRCDARAYITSLVRVTSYQLRPVRFLPVGPGRYRGYCGGRRARSCPSRTVAADRPVVFEVAPPAAFWHSNLLLQLQLQL